MISYQNGWNASINKIIGYYLIDTALKLLTDNCLEYRSETINKISTRISIKYYRKHIDILLFPMYVQAVMLDSPSEAMLQT